MSGTSEQRLDRLVSLAFLFMDAKQGLWSRERKRQHALFIYWLSLAFSAPGRPLTKTWRRVLHDAFVLSLYDEAPVALKQMVKVLLDLALEYALVTRDEAMTFLDHSDILSF